MRRCCPAAESTSAFSYSCGIAARVIVGCVPLRCSEYVTWVEIALSLAMADQQCVLCKQSVSDGAPTPAQERRHVYHEECANALRGAEMSSLEDLHRCRHQIAFALPV